VGIFYVKTEVPTKKSVRLNEIAQTKLRAFPHRRRRAASPFNAVSDRMSALAQRERELASRASARKKISIYIGLDEYESLLDAADKWDETINAIARAALREGLVALAARALPGANPLEARHPTLSWAPAALSEGLAPPQMYAARDLLPTAPSETYVETTEQVFRAPSMQGKMKELNGLLPSSAYGALEPYVDPGPPERTPEPPEPPQEGEEIAVGDEVPTEVETPE
jgi:hypothetical protein